MIVVGDSRGMAMAVRVVVRMLVGMMVLATDRHGYVQHVAVFERIKRKLDIERQHAE